MFSFLAGMVELVDAPDSKSGASNGVRVQVPLPAPQIYTHRFFSLYCNPLLVPSYVKIPTIIHC